MRSELIAFAIALLVSICCSAAGAEPVSCDSVRRALSGGADPESVAADLGTTRARVNACDKLADNQDRLSEQRAELHRERRERGIE